MRDDWHQLQVLHLVIDAVPAEGEHHVRKRSERLDINAHGHLKIGRPQLHLSVGTPCD